MAKRTGSWISPWATWFGAALIGLAVVSLGYEATVAVEVGAWRAIPAGEVWFKLDNSSLNLVQAVVQRYLHPFLWDPLIVGFLQWPPWATLGGLGMALTFIFRPRRSR